MPESLTTSELRVLRQAARGLSDNDSATESFHSRNTIQTHRKKIREKLAARNMAQAVAIGYELGLIQETVAAPSRRLTLWQQLDEREQSLFEDWLAGRIADDDYVIRWREIDAAFAALPAHTTRRERLRQAA